MIVVVLVFSSSVICDDKFPAVRVRVLLPAKHNVDDIIRVNNATKSLNVFCLYMMKFNYLVMNSIITYLYLITKDLISVNI